MNHDQSAKVHSDIVTGCSDCFARWGRLLISPFHQMIPLAFVAHQEFRSPATTSRGTGLQDTRSVDAA